MEAEDGPVAARTPDLRPRRRSGAILVAACRFLATRLVEAWTAEGSAERYDAEVVEIEARRRVVERCLYGVDRDPMAVEMAKLTLWLVTMAKDRPFTFLDHAIRRGDSLLGVADMEQLRWFHLDPEHGHRLHGQGRLDVDLSVFDSATKEAVELRRRLAEIPVNSVRDAELKADLAAKADARLADLSLVGDLLIGSALDTNLRGHGTLDQRVVSLQGRIAALLGDDVGVAQTVRSDLRHKAALWLNAGKPEAAPDRHPMHWCLAFPEIFTNSRRFDLMLGNPPFLGGKRISGAAGTDLREVLVRWIAGGSTGNADLVTYFFLRAIVVARSVAFLATNTITQGDTREVGLDRVIQGGWRIHRAVKSRPWPGAANLEIALVWMSRRMSGSLPTLNGQTIQEITSYLEAAKRATGSPQRLGSSTGQSFIGSALNTEAFIISRREAEHLIDQEPANQAVLKPFLNGVDVNTHPRSLASRYVIDFGRLTLEQCEVFPQVLQIARERVRPEVEGKIQSFAGWIERWWQFWRVPSWMTQSD